MFLLFVNRNRKATKNYENCVVKEMSFAAKFQLFSMKGKNNMTRITRGNSKQLLRQNSVYKSKCQKKFPQHLYAIFYWYFPTTIT